MIPIQGKKQDEEIKTITGRQYTINLSDADVRRLAEKAGTYNLTAAELLENFIGDLVNGTYSNGSDERDFAQGWADRCGFSFEPDKTLIQFLCTGENFHTIDDFMELRDEVQYINELQEDFTRYMGDDPFDWEQEVSAFLKWYQESIWDRL